MYQPAFWVVETARTTYWDGRNSGTEARYTTDIHNAMQFARFEDAERARCWLLADKDLLRAVEHIETQK